MGWVETRRIPVLLAAATLIPIAALCWLGVRIVAQDRELERQRHRERLEVVAGRIALEIERQLQEADARLAGGRGVRLLPGGLAAADTGPILYQPEALPALASSAPGLMAAAQQEFQQHNVESAIAAYRRLAGSQLPESGDALVALASLLRRQQRHQEALRVYDRLEQLGPAHVAGGQPAALVARQGRIKVYQETGDAKALRVEADALASALYRGGWAIDKATFGMYVDLITEWRGSSPDPTLIRRTDAAIELWHAWRRGEIGARGRRWLGRDGDQVLASWSTGAEGPAAAFFTLAQLRDAWQPAWDAKSVNVAVIGVDGRPMFGTRTEGAVTLSPADTRLPFVLAVSSAPADPSQAGTRRTLLMAGLIAAFGLIAATSLGLYRITTRELALARQQSDFVAAVSHEFRTPLTSMRHLTDLLVTRGVATEERKAHYYGLLAQETERLHRMVESLLSFGRIDAGAQTWHRERVEVPALVRRLAEDFRREARGRPLNIDIDAGLPAIDVDPEALSRALWNLLENAAKYSGADTAIRVFARASGRDVLIGVQDEGIGIPIGEQQRVFDKFVRGDAAKRAGIRGVGLGLALVKRIAEAHGGSVRLESQAGRGSTFTLVIPCREF